MSLEPCHSPALVAVWVVLAVLDLLSLILLLLCAMAGAAMRAEPSTAAARNLESIFILLRCCLTRNQLADARKGPRMVAGKNARRDRAPESRGHGARNREMRGRRTRIRPAGGGLI